MRWCPAGWTGPARCSRGGPTSPWSSGGAASDIATRRSTTDWPTSSGTSPIGEVKACGGDAMILMEAFRRVGGYNPSIIAAEDDELCLRIRGEGWKVLRIDAEMTLHDMAMTRFTQWWRRAVRCGHAYAEGSARYGRTPERHFVRQMRSTIVLGAVAARCSPSVWPGRPGVQASPCWRLPDPVLADRTLLPLVRGWPAADARLYAAFCVMAKFPQVIGIVKYWSRRIRGEPAQIIEYRGAGGCAAVPRLELSPSTYDGTH